MPKIVDDNRVHILAVKMMKQPDLMVIVYLTQNLSKIVPKIVLIVANSMPAWVPKLLPFSTGTTLF